MKVHTYFEPLGINDAEALLPIWTEAWSRAGFEPVVLTKDDIAIRDRALTAWFSRYPSAGTPPAYDLACYMRWFALNRAFDGGAKRALMVDLDVIPSKQWMESAGFACSGDVVFLEPNRVPCAVMATYSGLLEIQDRLAEGPVYVTRAGRGESNDMTVLQARMPHRMAVPVCLEYGAEGWDEAPMLHFPYSRVGANKAEAITKYLSS